VIREDREPAIGQKGADDADFVAPPEGSTPDGSLFNQFLVRGAMGTLKYMIDLARPALADVDAWRGPKHTLL
jgi:hypothetical protein